MQAGDSNQITRNYFDQMLLETRYIDADLADVTTEFLGEKFDTPIMTAALSHLNGTCENGMKKFAQGAKDANAVCFMGMGEDVELEDMVSTGARVVKIIKPHLDDAEVFRKIEHAKKNHALAVGMDIDHAFNGNGGYDVVVGLPMKPKTLSQMRSFVEASDLPFVVKGVLSVSDAKKAVEIGAKAIIVSHHHGIMPYSVPPLMVLPKIKEAVGDQLTILVDCGIESGMDAFKALALGADGVCVGRDLMNHLKEGSDAVAARIREMTGELKAIMSRTGAKSIKDIDPTVIHFLNGGI